MFANLKIWIFRAPNYVRAFGLFRGLLALLTIERAWPRTASARRRVTLPGFVSPLTLRKTKGDHAVVWQCLVQRQYDLACYPQWSVLETRYQAALASGKTPAIIDGGANIGCASVALATAFPDALVVAVEPDSDNFDLLKCNTKPYPQVSCIQGGVWPVDEYVRIENPEAGSTAFRLVASDEHAQGAIRGYPIETLVPDLPDHHLFFVKLDIEGAQRYLFEQNTQWIERADVIALELDDWLFPWSGSSVAFFRALSAHRFDYVMSGETLFCFRHTDAGTGP